MSVHAKLPPSGAKYWVPCTASIQYIELEKKAGNIPEDDSNVYSREGDEAHAWAAKVNWRKARIADVPEEFRAGVSTFCNYCDEVFDRYPGDVLFIEDKVPLFYSPGETGTIDWGIAGKEIGIHIIDFKYGKGVYVEAEENLQQAIYANSVRHHLEKSHYKKFTLKDSLPVTMTIVQPRYSGAAPVRTWTTTVGELKEFCLTIADSVMDIETGDRLKFAPHEDTCQFCPARHVPCIHKAKAAFSIVPHIDGKKALDMLPDLTAPTVPDLERLTDEQLVAIKRHAPLLQQFIKDADAVLLKRALEDPSNLPAGLKWVRGREGNREWIDEDEAERFLNICLNGREDEYAPRKLISPAVAKTLLSGKSKMVKGQFEDLIHRNPGKEVLATLDDKRDPIAPGATLTNKDLQALNQLPDLSEAE